MNLIYTMAYGEGCLAEARLMVESLRTAGQFDGEIQVFCERPTIIDGATVVASCDPVALKTFLIGRYYLGKSGDYRAYEKVMWLDSDVMAVRPLAELFDRPGFWIATEGIIRSMRDTLTFSVQETPCAIGDMSYNTGTMIGEAAGWNQFCQSVWSQIIHSVAWTITCHDQSVVNHLIRHGGVEMRGLPEGTVYFYHPGSAVGENTILVHASAPYKLEKMRLTQWHNAMRKQ